ncbi:hypothetical protein ACIQZO_03285 [Streptomyces sp. NPDC097617]|uniref:hypothetical protein n=1 Tax=Streptomyces sp. NPDC097617 TaxID=3366091 RepID=UPI0037FC370A
MSLPVAIVGGLHRDARRRAVRALPATVPGSVALRHDLAAAAVEPRAMAEVVAAHGCAALELTHARRRTGPASPRRSGTPSTATAASTWSSPHRPWTARA